MPLEHIVWRAFFVYLPSFPQAPAVYAQQGGLFCSVDLNIDNSNEVWLAFELACQGGAWHGG